jgi:hypothetical protein
MKYIPILDAGIAMRSRGTYPAFDEGVNKDVFVKIGQNNDILVG